MLLQARVACEIVSKGHFALTVAGGQLRPLWWLVRQRKWCSLPRLETRTKESDTNASIEVANLGAQ